MPASLERGPETIRSSLVVDLSLTADQQAVRELADTLATQVVAPVAEDAERRGGVPAQAWKHLLDSGLVAQIPDEYGGGGLLDPLDSLLTTERLAMGDAAVTAAATWSGNAAILLALCGSDRQCGELLPKFLEPSTRAAVAMYEGHGRAPSEYQTTITRDGGQWRLYGRKSAVASGEVANPLIVVGTDPAESGRLRAAVVTARADVTTVGGSHLGLDAAPIASLSFDLTLDDSSLLGGPDSDPADLSRALSRLRLTTAALAIGCAQRATEYAAKYAAGRVVFGRPLADFQGVSFMIVDAQMQIDAARLQVWELATDAGHRDPACFERSVSAAIGYATSIAAAVTRDCVQVLGGHGFITDHPVERWYREAAGLAALDLDPTCSAFAPAL
jgi:alkylation response protein AidB-like acyl-CoA dehydrogenase